MVREFRLAKLSVHSLASIVYTLELIVGHKVIQTDILYGCRSLRIECVQETLGTIPSFFQCWLCGAHGKIP